MGRAFLLHLYILMNSIEILCNYFLPIPSFNPGELFDAIYALTVYGSNTLATNS
jgi:hypothetical protein